MASAFKNAGQANPTTDDATADVYTAPSNGTAVLHAVYISNTTNSQVAYVDIKVTVDKPVNLEQNDKIRVVSNITGTETYLSVLENT
jgi:hypothetical protein